MKLGNTVILDTFAEAFRMQYTRVLITAHDSHWLGAAVRELVGYSASVISCDGELGVERWLSAEETPDGRPGASILAFGFSAEGLAKALVNRIGQCVMTCPTTAVYDGLPEAEKRIPLGKQIRFFGDGFQKSKLIDGRRFWRVPVMDGEFLIEQTIGVTKGIGGGNIILQATDLQSALDAAKRGVAAVEDQYGVISPFPGGVARSGSKVGSRYKGIVASTADAYCPTLRNRVETELLEGVNCVYEIVIDGIDEEPIQNAMAMIMQAVAGEGIVAIGAGNYGGKLGKYHFKLHEILSDTLASS